MKQLITTGTLFIMLCGSISGQINEKRNLSETSHQIYFACYNPTGEFIVTAGSDNNINIWNVETGIIFRTLVGLKKRPNQVVFSSNSKVLYSAGEDGLITTWDATLVKATRTTLGHSGAIEALAINSEETLLATGGEDKILMVWSVSSGSPEVKYELKGHKKNITTLAFSPDGRHIISGSEDNTLILWDVKTGRIIRRIDAHKGGVRCARFSPDGKQICSAGNDRKLKTWDAVEWTNTGILEGHEDWVQTLSYTPSGNYIISGGHDATIRIWNAATGQQEAVSEKLEQIVLSVDASPVNNDFISSCLYSEKLRIWASNRSESPVSQNLTSSVAINEPVAAAVTGTVTKSANEPDKESPAKAADIGPDLPSIMVFSPMANNGRIEHDKNTILIVGKAEGRGGIQTVLINLQMAQLNDDGVFQADVSLAKGENKIELVAVSQKGKMSRSEMVIYCTSETASSEVIGDATVQTGMGKGKYYALIIGIDQYADEKINDLDYPIRDASYLYETLINQYTFNEEDIFYLKNPTRTEIIIALDNLGQIVSPSDNLLIFFAGHGHWDEKSRIGYWLPGDAAESNTANWFRNSTLRTFIGSIQSQHTLLIADACFSGSIFKTRSAFASEDRGISKLYDLPSRKAMTSGTSKEEVPDESVFVKYLIQELKKNEASYLPSATLFRNFETAVRNNSSTVPQYGTVQNVGDEGGDFIFIRK
jgi:WD40 repeat protein